VLQARARANLPKRLADRQDDARKNSP